MPKQLGWYGNHGPDMTALSNASSDKPGYLTCRTSCSRLSWTLLPLLWPSTCLGEVHDCSHPDGMSSHTACCKVGMCNTLFSELPPVQSYLRLQQHVAVYIIQGYCTEAWFACLPQSKDQHSVHCVHASYNAAEAMRSEVPRPAAWTMVA